MLAFVLAAGPVWAGPPDGQAVIRAPAGDSEIVITTTHRLAGAIHSLKWHGHEFINSADHGRQLQSACSFDNTAAAGAETYNPTEAGSRRDGAGLSSTSRLLELTAHDGVLSTRTQMAFWLAPGERSEGSLARNTTTLSGYILSKHVAIGYRSWPQALDYRVTFTLPAGAHHTDAQYEALTGYLPPEFSQFWQFNPRTRQLEPLSDGPGEINNPVVLATPDGKFAMGIYAPPTNVGHPSYGRWKFDQARVVKWNCVFRVHDSRYIYDGDYAYQLLVPVGTMGQVQAMLSSWQSVVW